MYALTETESNSKLRGVYHDLGAAQEAMKVAAQEAFNRLVAYPELYCIQFNDWVIVDVLTQTPMLGCNFTVDERTSKLDVFGQKFCWNIEDIPPAQDDFECLSEICVFVHDGVCKYPYVCGKMPVFDDTKGCLDCVCNW